MRVCHAQGEKNKKKTPANPEKCNSKGRVFLGSSAREGKEQTKHVCQTA